MSGFQSSKEWVLLCVRSHGARRATKALQDAGFEVYSPPSCSNVFAGDYIDLIPGHVLLRIDYEADKPRVAAILPKSEYVLNAHNRPFHIPDTIVENLRTVGAEDDSTLVRELTQMAFEYRVEHLQTACTRVTQGYRPTPPMPFTSIYS